MHKNALEWTVFAVSLVLMASLVGALSVAAWKTDAPPRLVVTVGAPVAQPGGAVFLPVRVQNDGPKTAAAVAVELTVDGRTVPLTFDYVPRHSERSGVAALPSMPRGPVSGRVVAYSEP